MSTPSRLDDVVDVLAEAQRASWPPAHVQQKLCELGDGAIELVWQTLPAANGYEYQALVAGDDGSTVVLATSTPATIPWPLRAAQRWSERDYLCFNRTVVSVAEVVQALELQLQRADVTGHLLDCAVMREELTARPVTPTSADRQAALDRVRRARRL
ncbi:MAG TPA: hypothetical protein VHW01_14420, partial [Polyangiaceae bacterium]|nr:hypothetical protein [Polyangiaceae bacterium]